MKHETEAVPFDLTMLPGGADVLRGVPPAACVIITNAALRMLEEHPGMKAGDMETRAHELWDRVRGIVYDQATGFKVERPLCSPGITGGHLLLRDVLRLLIDGKRLECALVDQRDAIDAQLARLRGRRPVPPHAA